ncbi:MAG TPA: hypothetical protein VFD43_12235, partial [Planctomycetota bacterium]|nr:hypothetical protein [Planctomycetota bacterium]
MRRALLVLLGLPLLGAGCTRDDAPRPDAVAAAPSLRAGDSLLDCLAAARLERWTDVVLPAPVAALVGPALLVNAPIEPGSWREGPGVAAKLVDAAGAGAGLRVFRTRAGARHRLDSAPPEILRAGRPQAAFQLGGELPAGGALWYHAEHDLLVALASEPPPDVSLRYPVGSGDFPGGLRPREAGPPTAPSALRRRAVVGATSRDALDLPAPGAIAFELARLDGDELALAAAVVDRGCRVVHDALQADSGLSDGVTFAVDIEARDGGEPAAARLWERHVRPADGWIEARLALAGFRGRPVRLRLATEP